ncbi:MAG: DUF1684 domain-containing protein [Acidobacteriota bacterium]|jgi:uncharacterized protein (DUF1684 family)|nr:DUF1684 domain-containing protein [Acidobacteriota bacterium]NLT32692.1 DUF1684 domain-containing protein [Acidobacteriota bacterium]
MKNLMLALIAFSLAGCARQGQEPTARPVRIDPEAAATVTAAIERERAETLDWLRTSPRSYLAAVDRVDFGGKESLIVGSDPAADLTLEDEAIRPRHLRITVEGDLFRVEALDDGALFRLGDKEMREGVTGPSYIQAGRFHLRLSHQNFPALIVFDPESPRFAGHKEPRWFPVDLAWRYELPLERDPAAEKTVILSTRGHRRTAERAGWFHFSAGGKECRLEATRLLEPGSGQGIGVYFRDATSGRETYALGRYVDAVPLENGNYLLDFNQAYNPACAFSEFYNCPVPPKANTLTVPVRAGEMDSHYH